VQNVANISGGAIFILTSQLTHKISSTLISTTMIINNIAINQHGGGIYL